MNIDDVKNSSTIKTVEDMFKRQIQLMSKYDGIERSLGAMVPVPPYDLDSRVVQYRLKDLFWRVTEELAEAMEALESVNRSRLYEWKDLWGTQPYIRHYFEELSDALHFLIEASIISNIPLGWVEAVFKANPAMSFDYIRSYHWEIVYRLGITANCLKNKPWKQTEVPTDITKCHNNLILVWVSLYGLFGRLGLKLQDILKLYEKKSVVNSWRQKTNY